MTGRPVTSGARGAVLVHVAILMIVLLGVSALSIDLGIMWLARAQAQNAADAGALAGAISLAFDGVDTSPTGPASTKAVTTANQNLVFGQPAGVTADDVLFAPDPRGDPWPATCIAAPDTCVRVNVYRSQAHGNALPTFFARLFGVTNQGVQAMAIAQAAYANAAKCLKPWAIPDKWDENYPVDKTWGWTDTFDLFDRHGNPVIPPDSYHRREFISRSPLVLDQDFTGFRASPPWPSPGDVGTEVRLKMGSPHDAPTPGWFLPIDLPVAGPDPGGDQYRENIANCNPTEYKLGDDLIVEPGNMIGPTRQGIDALIAKDPTARFVPGPGGVGGYVVCGVPTCDRWVSLAVYDPEVYELNRHSGRVAIEIATVLGFFVDRMDGNDVMGYFVGAPGYMSGSNPSDQTSWLRVIQLIR